MWIDESFEENEPISISFKFPEDVLLTGKLVSVCQP